MGTDGGFSYSQYGYLSPNGLADEVFHWPYPKTSGIFDSVLQYVSPFFTDGRNGHGNIRHGQQRKNGYSRGGN